MLFSQMSFVGLAHTVPLDHLLQLILAPASDPLLRQRTCCQSKCGMFRLRRLWCLVPLI